ncbi:hypothetical protein GY31_12140, partial [Lysinibacillus sphaericus]
NAGAGGTSSAMGFSCLGGWGAQYIAGSQNHLPGRGGASTSWYSVRGADGGGGIANQSGGNGGKGLVIIEW